jgi:hypothetical protein
MNRIPRLAKWLALLLSLLGIGACFWAEGSRQTAEGSRQRAEGSRQTAEDREQTEPGGGNAAPSAYCPLPSALCVYGPRVGMVVFALAAWYLSQSLISSRGMKSGAIGDGLLELFGPSMHPFIALIIVFVMRQACQGICALPTPPGMIWRYPGAPSLLVTYDVANDFFFSGHTSIAVLGAIEAARMFPWWVGAAVAGIAVCEAGVVLVLRAHYTMDVIVAVFAAFCAAGLADWLCAAW